MEHWYIVDTYIKMLEHLKKGTIKDIKIESDYILFEVEDIKQFYPLNENTPKQKGEAFTRYIKLPMTEWFKNQYSLNESVGEY